MRKRTVNHVADTVFWYFIYFLPVLCYFLYLFAEPSSGSTVVSFSAFFENIGIGFVSHNVVVSALSSLFGSTGILPLFSTDVPFIIFGWFICTFIGHLAVDFLLFIPRLCHKFMEKFTQNGD